MAGRSLPKIEAAIAELTSAGQPKTSFTPLQLDVTDEASIRNAAAAVASKFGHIDVLFNNAGISVTDGPLAEKFQHTFATNVIGPVLVSDAFKPLLLKAEKPKSIYVTSSTGSLGMMVDPKSRYRSAVLADPAYRSSKAALNMIAMHDQVDNENTNISVYAICPGFVVSNLRGTSAEQRNPRGTAEDPKTSAELVLSILRGEREADKACMIGRTEAHPW